MKRPTKTSKPRKPAKPKSAGTKTTKAVVNRRVGELLQIRLDGAEFWDCKEFIRERENARGKDGEDGSVWELKAGHKPLSDGQIWRYIGRADKLIAASCRAHGKKLLRTHLARRQNLYAKAVLAGDYRTALAVLRDQAEMQGLYPVKGDKPPGAVNVAAGVVNIFVPHNDREALPGQPAAKQLPLSTPRPAEATKPTAQVILPDCEADDGSK
jgi:hypothetical protein